MVDDGTLVMMMSGSATIIGRYEKGKLLRPRVFTLDTKKQEMHLAPLLWTPSEVIINGEPYYPIPIRKDTVNIYKLYNQVTTPKVDPNDPAFEGSQGSHGNPIIDPSVN